MAFSQVGLNGYPIWTHFQPFAGQLLLSYSAMAVRPSPQKPEDYIPERYVAAFEEIRKALSVEQWFVIGQSLGAGLTLRYVLGPP